MKKRTYIKPEISLDILKLKLLSSSEPTDVDPVDPPYMDAKERGFGDFYKKYKNLDE